MISFAELATALERQLPRVKPEMLRVTEGLMHAVALDAYDSIGLEKPEWPKLADSTVEDKTRGGYVGRRSATDPLYRTGETRKMIRRNAEITPVGIEAVVGSESKVLMWHELGTVRMPARPVFALAMKKIIPLAIERFGVLAVELIAQAKP